MFDLQPGDDLAALRRQPLELSQHQRHRGPDWRGMFVDAGVILVHERLAIVDPASGVQPLRSRDGALSLAVNGEIYNHRKLASGLDYDVTIGSDCEVINALCREHGIVFAVQLKGIFAFALWGGTRGRYLIARDPIGVWPLYWDTTRRDDCAWPRK
jgi:asparagine synthase (glutamine-hydrolysing)